MRQKHPIHSFVRVAKDMPISMGHFDSDFDAIVAGTYSQLCGGSNTDSYQVYKIEDGVIVNRIAWYKESQLEALPDQDVGKAASMVERCNTEDDET